jgi:hypothetical protein
MKVVVFFSIKFMFLAAFFLAVASPSVAQQCEPQLLAPVKDWDDRTQNWRAKILIAEFAVPPSHDLCPSKGKIGPFGNTTVRASAGDALHLWVRLQGNERLFEKPGTGAVDKTKRIPLPVKLIATFGGAENTPQPMEQVGLLDGENAYQELIANETRLQDSPSVTGVGRRYFDYRLRYTLKNVPAGAMRIQVLVDEEVAQCRKKHVRACDCPQGDKSCGLVLTVRE